MPLSRGKSPRTHTGRLRVQGRVCSEVSVGMAGVGLKTASAHQKQLARHAVAVRLVATREICIQPHHA